MVSDGKWGVPQPDAQTKGLGSKAKGCLVWLIGIVAIFGLLTLCVPDDLGTPPAPVPAAPAGPEVFRKIEYVTDFRDDGITVQVTALVKNTWDGPFFIDQASMIVSDFAKAAQKHPEALKPDAEYVIFLVQAPVVDRLGNESVERLLNMTFRVSDLRQVKTDTVAFARLMDLAHEARASNAAGAKAVEEWCAKGSNWEDARSFCGQVLN